MHERDVPVPAALLGTTEGWDSPAELAPPGPLGLEASSKTSSLSHCKEQGTDCILLGISKNIAAAPSDAQLSFCAVSVS